MLDLTSVSAFDGLLRPAGTGEGLTVRERTGFGLATIMAADRAAPAPRLPGGVRLLGISRGVWLALGEGGSAFAAGLATMLAGTAHIADQSGAYGLLELTGPKAPDVLAKGLPVDLHAAAFPDEAVAVSQIARIGVIVWRIPGGFALLTPRSSGGSFWHWLALSASAYGLRIA